MDLTTETVFDNLLSGLKTNVDFDSRPPSVHVSWIAWDSGFRGSGLQVGDAIVAVDGQSIPNPPELSARQKVVRESPGGLNESDVFIAKGLRDGSPLTLTVRRRRLPGEGWLALNITGRVLAERRYTLPNQRRAIGPNGPDALTNDGFDGSWSMWCEKRVFDWERILDGGWQRKLDTRAALEDHRDEKPRVDLLNEKYPGPFATAMRADWAAINESLQGTRYEIAPDSLAFRELEEERVKTVAALAALGWQDFLARHAADLVDPSLHVDPLRDDRSKIAGKLVALPAMGQRDWITSINRNFLTSRQNGSWYFVAADSAPMIRAFTAMQRYKQRVSPHILEDQAIVGRILPDPRMVVVQGVAVPGFEVEPLAVLIGDAMFIDLTPDAAGVTAFAGEDGLKIQAVAPPPDDAPPRQVLETLVSALKAGDQDTWSSLFADWRFVPDDEKPFYYPFYPYTPATLSEDWIRSRRRVLGLLADVRVVWIDEPRVLQIGEEYPGAPRIEQMRAELEHIGLFAAEYRAFSSVETHRQWTLQRRNVGPWRIASQQGI